MDALQVVSRETALQQEFAPFEAQANEWMEKAKGITVTDAGQTDLMAGAREARLALRDIRISIGGKHKELKEDALREGQLLDKIKRTLTGLIEPIESHLEEQEKFVEVQEAKVKKELSTKRATALSPYMTLEEATTFPLAEMTEGAFVAMLEGYKVAKENQVKEEKRVLLEQNKVKEENIRLANERFQIQKKLDRERAERKRLEDEAEAIREKEEQRKKDEANAKRRAARLPDKEKLEALTRTLFDVAGKFPKMSSEEGEAIVEDCRTMIGKMVSHINKKMEQL